MNILEFTNAMKRYATIQVYLAPDFNNVIVAEFWFKQLSHIDTKILGESFTKLCCKHRFPCIEDVLTMCKMQEPDDDFKARQVADKIYTAISKFGSTREYDKVKNYVGVVADKVIGGSNGWTNICNITTYNNASTMKAQWRESAKGYLKITQNEDVNYLTENKRKQLYEA